jgi:hypothetical protein
MTGPESPARGDKIGIMGEVGEVGEPETMAAGATRWPRRLPAGPAGRTGVAMFATAILVVVILFVRMIAAGGVPFFLGQDVDPWSAALVLASMVFGLWLTRGPRLIPIPNATDRRLLLVALAVFGILAAGALFIFGTSPITPDEEAALFQARLFAGFEVIGHYPTGLVDQMLLPAYHNAIILVGADGRAISVYWPGWALLMTPFVWLGVPWLLGPVMAGLSVFLAGKIAVMLGGVRAGAIAVLLTVTSGAFLLTGMSIYPACGHLALSLLFAWLLLRGGKRDALLAGLVGGLALVFNNPFPHAAFALPWGVWLLADAERRRRIIPLIVGYVPGLVVLVGWVLLQGTLRTADASSANEVWITRLSMILTVPNLTSVSYRFWELARAWGWSAPGLLVLAWVGWRRYRGSDGMLLLGASFIVTVLMYCAFPTDQGLGYGARYYHVAWGALPILASVPLAAAGWERLRNFTVAAALVGLVLVVPLQAAYAHNLAGISNDPLSKLKQPGVDLCFVDFDQVRAPGITMNNNPSTQGFLVLISQGQAADQALVDKYFPGSRLIVTTSFGSGYERP